MMRTLSCGHTACSSHTCRAFCAILEAVLGFKSCETMHA